MNKEIIVTEVYGRRPAALNQLDVVGKMFSEYSIDSASYEIINLEFDSTFAGVESAAHNRGGAIMTFAKSVSGADRDIVSPIIMVTSSYRSMPIHVLASGIISRVTNPINRKNAGIIRDHSIGSCSVIVITPGRTPDTVTEWYVKLPAGIRLDRKVVFIKKFNMYIGGVSYEQMEEIRDGGVLVARQIDSPRAVVDIHVRANVEGISTLHYAFNGIFGKVGVSPTTESMGTITLRVGELILTEAFSNKDLISMKEPIYRLWNNFGGIELLVDVDQDRLSQHYEQIRSISGTTPPDVLALVRELRTDIVRLNDENAKLKLKVSELAQKASDAEHKLKMEQEEFKTRREEIKYQSSLADQRNANVIDMVKLGGAFLGIISLIITLATKFSVKPSKATSGLVEWALPILFKRGLTAAGGC